MTTGNKITQTRFKIALITVALFLIEGAIKAFAPIFPLTEVLAAQGLVVGAYFGAKTANNITEVKYNDEAS